MTCLSARQRLAGYVQERLGAAEQASIRRHLQDCAACFEEYEYQARLDSPLRELTVMEPPLALDTAIRLRLMPQHRPSLWDRWQVHLSNLMRPVALPAAGGLLSALILFGILLPAVQMTRAAGVPGSGYDLRTNLVTEPRFKNASPFPVTEDLTVEAWIDERGNITNFEVLSPTPMGAAVEKMLLLQSTNVLLTTKFEPATRFGQPTAGKVLLSFRRINIRG
jgi:anti-sigma factor RsiW